MQWYGGMCHSYHCNCSRKRRESISQFSFVIVIVTVKWQCLQRLEHRLFGKTNSNLTYDLWQHN
jgi:hypothetical protein